MNVLKRTAGQCDEAVLMPLPVLAGMSTFVKAGKIMTIGYMPVILEKAFCWGIYELHDC